MLILTRKENEAIMIGKDVEITVVKINGDKIRIGIKAPTSVAVHRKEIYEQNPGKASVPGLTKEEVKTLPKSMDPLNS